MTSTSLPKGWVHKNGAYFYRPPKRFQDLLGSGWIKLGKTLPEAYRTFSTLPVHGEKHDIYLVRQLADKYQEKVVGTKAPLTQRINLQCLVEIRKVFGHIPIHRLEPRHCYDYYEAKSESRMSRAVLEVLRHMFTKAVEWGLLSRHPLKGQLVLKKHKPRNRYVSDDELVKFRALA